MHASTCTRTAAPPEDQAGGFGRPAPYLQEREEMRSGGCAVQQELAPDAAAVVRQAVSLARRRGHAQVTPLHAASAMLADAGGLLRASCLRSRASSHPLQCKALELCFNVALNRLATAGPPAPAMFQQFHAHHVAGGHRAPALSNALAAAFKRAQANQRRGAGSTSADVAARVELEQLVVSILDDPGVSRVMREAGFSSAEVKANVEKVASSPEQQSSNTASSTTSAASPKTKPSRESNKAKADAAGDAARVLDCMASGRSRCVAIVGESTAAAEGVVKAVMDKVSKGDLRLQHECLKNAQLVPFSVASFQRLSREEVDARAGDLRALIREARAAGKAVVLVVEDLACAAEAWAAASWKRSGHARYYYCPVEHAVMELSNLVRGGGGRGHDMFWLLGFSAYASYTSCRSGQPSLEAVLELHPILVPDGSLAMSLAGDSEITHCAAADMATPTAASVPSWIRRCQQQGPVPTGSELTLSFFSPASSSLSGFARHDANMSCEPRHDLIDRRRQPLHLQNHGHYGPAMADSCDQQLIVNPNPGSSNSVSKSNSSDGATEPADRGRRKFTELTAENLKILCGALEARVPRHRDIAPGIASAVLQRRSGVTRMTRPSSATTWLLFKGRDSDGKTAMARELARLVFGSYAEFTCITAPYLTLAPAGSNSGDSLKRQSPPDDEHGYVQRLYEAIRENPHRVVMIDGTEHDSVEYGIKNAMATGTVRGCDGDVVSLEDAIVVSCDEVFESSSRVSSPRLVKQQRVMSDVVVNSKVEEDGAEKGDVPRSSLDLNACAAAMDGEGKERSPPANDMEILKAVDGVFFFQY